MAKTKFITPSWRMSRYQDRNNKDSLSVLFDGNNDVTNLSIPFDVSGEITYSLSFFIKRNSNPLLSYGYLCGDGLGEGWAMSQGGTGSGIVEGQFYMYGGAAGGVQIVSNTPINADQWYHICIVVDQTGTSVVEFYIDGQLDKTTNSWTGGIEPEDIGQISTIGSNKSGANQWEFDGNIARASFYDYKLSASQVLQLSQGNNQGLTSPVQDYNFGDYSVYDSNNLNTAADEYLGQPNLTFQINDTNDNVFKVDDFGDVYGDNYNGDFGFSCWFKLTSTTTDEGIMQVGTSSYDPFSLYYYTSRGGLGFELGAAEFETDILKSTLGTGWNHIAFSTDNNGNHQCWLNNQTITLTEEANYTEIDFKDEDLYIGRYYGTSYVVDGSVCGVAFFKQELTNAIVEDLYNNGDFYYSDPNTLPGVSDCVAYYGLTEKDTTDVNGDVISIPLKMPTGITGGTGLAEGQNQDVGLFLKATLPNVTDGLAVGTSLNEANIYGESKFSSYTAVSFNMGLNAETEDSGRSEDIPQ